MHKYTRAETTYITCTRKNINTYIHTYIHTYIRRERERVRARCVDCAEYVERTQCADCTRCE